jgi:ATP-dependent helicase/nuclease subunit A
VTAPREPKDHAAREKALTDFETNFLVEAGAGSGKTTLLAGRMAALVEDGKRTSQLAAVTFTRKAAGELRERFQLELERALADACRASGANGSSERIARLKAALDHIDEAFLGTIHSFCARLLRERPIEAGLDPGFREVEQDESDELRGAWWRTRLEQLHLAGDPDLVKMLDLGIEPEQLATAFTIFDRYPDVDFSADPAPAPDVTRVRAAVEKFLDVARQLMPRDEPASGWDDLQQLVRRLQYERRNDAWATTPGFCDVLAGIGPGKLTQNRWIGVTGDDRKDKAAAKALGEDFERLKAGDVDNALRQWWAHRYPFVAALLRRAARAFADVRVRSSVLDFKDLLIHAARLLRSDAGTRRALGERFRYVLVDEFQDTDPVQAEVLFLLASDPSDDPGPASWTAARLRPGALFVVGDPKQSIYRFTRADVTTYTAVKDLLARQGVVLTLTANFRSVPQIATLVNAHFGNGGVFPAEATAQQARFAPMEPMRGATGKGGVFHYDVVAPNAKPSAGTIVAIDAAWVASFIEARIAANERAPEDFLVLCRGKKTLAAYARALAQRNIPASVTGAETEYETELHELQIVLQALDDPTNAILAVAALESVFIGATPADLWAAREAGLAFQIAVVPHATTGEETARVARVRDGLHRLHAWLALSRRAAPDELLETIFDDTGLLVRTAADDLGDQRAGLLLDLVARVRSATTDAAGATETALTVLDRLLASEAPEASLRPGRTDAVRVMNLHKAKGLESTVVILAAPTLMNGHEVEVAVRREGDSAKGGVPVTFESQRTRRVLAQPLDWDEQAASEQAFLDAQEDRLLYVAATRAGEELVIARLMLTPAHGPQRLAENTPWVRLQPALDDHSTAIERVPSVARGRAPLEEPVASIAKRVAATGTARGKAAAPSYALTTVSRSAKADAGEPGDLLRAAGAGVSWGRAVHRALEWMARGGGDEALGAMAATIARDETLVPPLDAAALVRCVRQAMERPEWKALVAASERIIEFPLMEWRTGGGKSPMLIEGVIDAAYRDDGAWTVLDWKTDLDDAAFADRRRQYQKQVDEYAEMLARATGREARGLLVRLA